MPALYETIDSLCKQKGISAAKMCSDLGISRSTVTELRKGRAKSISVDTAAKIAQYFGISVDQLLGAAPAAPAKPRPAASSESLRLPLKSVARIEGSNITKEEDAAISAFVDYLLAEREKDG